jgi:ABC-type molybdenum transport system ATPase subunit/photorepair protein PhrA
VVDLGLGEVADERVGVVQHPRLAHADEPLVGMDLDEREVAPGRAGDVCRDTGDAHVQRMLLV